MCSLTAFEVLGSRTWPGNVRELENALERALVLSGGTIDAEHVGEPEPRAQR